MAGFFKSAPAPAPKKAKAGLPLDCTTCGLDKDCRTPRMPAAGKGKLGVLIIAESPGPAEDAKGVPLVGQAGQFLQEVLEDIGYNLDRDCRKINAVACKLPKRKDPGPTDLEIACCRERVWDEIRAFKPHVIITLGNAALESLLSHRLPKEAGQEDAAVGALGVWRGWRIPDRDIGAWVCPTYHPSYVLREENNPAVEVLFRQDIQAAFDMLEYDLPPAEDDAKNVEICTHPETIRAYLRSLITSEARFAFDYETTGLKPYAAGHKILCCGISTDGVSAFAFPVCEDVKYDLIQALIHNNPKIAQNMSFEDLWSWVILGYRPEAWEWDTMLVSHILNNQTRTGLKFQAYANFGIVDYASHVTPFLRGRDDKDANSFNALVDWDPEGPYDRPLVLGKDKLYWDDLLRYCGMDALLEYRLSEVQRPQMEGSEGAYALMHKGALDLVQAQKNGIRIDVEYCQQQSAHLKRRISYTQKKLMESDAGRVWKQMYGAKFNINSNAQLGKVLFDHYQLTTEHKTASGQNSTSKDSLESLDHPLVRDVLTMRKLTKIEGTYLQGWLREVRNGYMHPFFHLHKVVTFRSSSANPNFQNIPKRDKESERITRRAIIPRPGHLILEVDFSGIEVRIAATYHKDPTMLTYIKDDSKDMHRDMAIQLYMTGDLWTKPLRQAAKNKFVFPEFYGDYYKNCAEGLWSDAAHECLKDGTPVHEHLKRQGIRNLREFVEHVKQVEEDFWGRRFKGYAKWKEKHVAEYHTRGFIKLHTGFVCQGVMAKNDVINYVVQGAAFHCLLWTFSRLTDFFNNRGLRSCIIGQIHDSVVMDVHPDELQEILAAVKAIVSRDLVREWKWINVPMAVEAEATGIDEPWYTKKEISL